VTKTPSSSMRTFADPASKLLTVANLPPFPGLGHAS
jgi:hypothetical protein